MYTMQFLELAALFITTSSSVPASRVELVNDGETGAAWKRIEIGPGTIWISCKYQLPVRFDYIARFDDGCFPRSKRFRLHPDRQCQQKATRSYPRICLSPLCGEAGCDATCEKQCAGITGPWSSYRIRYREFKASCEESISYDRGHLIPANHLDYNRTLIAMSNFMINISPQVAQMNRGAWLYTEELTECWRDIEPLHIFGGSVWNDFDDEPGMEGRNEWFRPSHEVQTPVYFWKIIKAPANGTIASLFGIHYIAFWVPNTKDATRKNIHAYVVTLARLEENLRQYQQPMTFDESQKDVCYGNPCGAWSKPDNCDLS